jgi:N utilization substance protein B
MDGSTGPVRTERTVLPRIVFCRWLLANDSLMAARTDPQRPAENPSGRTSPPMARRSRARAVALQVLFQDDINPPDAMSVDTDRFLHRRLASDELVELARSLVSGVRRNKAELDALLARTAVNWSLERMAVTDRNILRLGAYEILFTDTPDRVAINEAVELAKRFGTGQSAQFVNGILDKFLEGHRET